METASPLPGVRLNVGGTLFETTKSTLEQFWFFRALFSFPDGEAQRKEFFIDRDPGLFKHILRKARDASYRLPFYARGEMGFYEGGQTEENSPRCMSPRRNLVPELNGDRRELASDRRELASDRRELIEKQDRAHSGRSDRCYDGGTAPVAAANNLLWQDGTAKAGPELASLRTSLQRCTIRAFSAGALWLGRVGLV